MTQDELVEAFVAEMKTLSRKGGVIEYPDIFAAALSALSSKGLAVVPTEPTEAMLAAGRETYDKTLSAHEAWKAAMLAARPKEGA